MNKLQAHNATHNEGGEGYNPIEANAAARAEVAAEAHFQTLVARADELRAAWNAAVAANTVNGQVSMTALRKIEQTVGVTQNEMRMLKDRGAFSA